jgi:hypothetical protein
MSSISRTPLRASIDFLRVWWTTFASATAVAHDGASLGDFLDLDEAHAADARDRQPRVVAVVRHEHTRVLCRLEDGGAGGDGDLPSLDRERYAHRCVCH